MNLVKNFDWQSSEGQSLLRFKYDLYDQWLKQPESKQETYNLSEAFVNQAILLAYRKGKTEQFTSSKEMQENIIDDIIYQLQAMK